MRIAKNTAGNFNLPIMVHIGDSTGQVPPNLTSKLLPLMEKGDILEHTYTAKAGGVLRPDGTLLTGLREAIDRGIILDIGRGITNFSYDITIMFQRKSKKWMHIGYPLISGFQVDNSLRGIYDILPEREINVLLCEPKWGKACNK